MPKRSQISWIVVLAAPDPGDQPAAGRPEALSGARRRDGRATSASSQATRSSRRSGGLEHLGVLEEVSTKDRKARVAHGRASTTEPSLAVAHDRRPGEVGDVPRPGRRRPDPGLDGWSSPSCQGWQLGDRAPRARAALEGVAVRLDGHLALDAVQAELRMSCARGQAGEVPAAPPEVEAVGSTGGLDPAVGESHPASRRDGAEQQREPDVGGQGGHGLAAPGAAAEASAVITPPSFQRASSSRGRRAGPWTRRGAAPPLVGLEAGVGQVVLVPGDAVAVPGRVRARERVARQGHPELAEVLLVPLEGPVEGGVLPSGIAARPAPGTRPRSAGAWCRAARRQVHQPSSLSTFWESRDGRRRALVLAATRAAHQGAGQAGGRGKKAGSSRGSGPWW